MGWNSALTVVKDCTMADLAGHLAYGEPMTCDAAGDGAVAVAVSQDVVIAGDPGRTDEIVAALAPAGRRLVSVLLSSTADTYELRVQDGTDVVRRLVAVEGSLVVDEGDPLPRESLADEEPFGEDRFLALWQITGSLMFGDWFFDPDGRAVAPAGHSPQTPDPETTRRGLRRHFGRA